MGLPNRGFTPIETLLDVLYRLWVTDISGDLKFMAISGKLTLCLGDRASMDMIKSSFSFLTKCLFLLLPTKPLVLCLIILIGL